MEQFERKLSAIMFTDIFGYSRMMSENENKAVQLLSTHDNLIEKSIDNYKGHVIKKIGDSIMAVFNSSSEALSCAVEIQTILKDYNIDKSEDDKIIIRIGIHVGDVIVKDNDIFGEGVNVAARLEQLAEPGGICLSSAVYDSAKSSKQFNILKQGEVELKNILEKYIIYKVPSVYGDQYIKKENVKETKAKDNQQEFNYKIKQILKLPVRFLSPLETAIYSIILNILLIFGTTYIFLLFDTESNIIGLSEFIISLFDKPGDIILITTIIIFNTLLLIYFYASKSVRVLFSDIRDTDKIIMFLVKQIGYKPTKKINGRLIFKPTLYQYIMYSARKIKVLIDGNSAVISGNFMMVRKLVKILKAMEG